MELAWTFYQPAILKNIPPDTKYVLCGKEMITIETFMFTMETKMSFVFIEDFPKKYMITLTTLPGDPANFCRYFVLGVN